MPDKGKEQKKEAPVKDTPPAKPAPQPVRGTPPPDPPGGGS